MAGKEKINKVTNLYLEIGVYFFISVDREEKSEGVLSPY